MRDSRSFRDRPPLAQLKRLLWGWAIIGATMLVFGVFALGFSRALRVFAPAFAFYTILEGVLFLSRIFIKSRQGVGEP